MTGHFSIVLPTYYSDSLMDTIRGILSQSDFDQVLEILVVGQQNFEEELSIPKVRYIDVRENPTPARNRNIGVYHSSGEWICFLDSDSVPIPNWLYNLQITIEEGEKIIAGAVDIPATMPYWGKCDHYAGFGDQARGIYSGRYLPFAASINLCIQKKTFIELLGFNEGFKTAGGEDREFCWRAVQSGEQIRFNKNAIVSHNHSRASFTSCWRHIYHYGQVTAQFRRMYIDQRPSRLAIGFKLAQKPIIGEIAAIFHATIRYFQRLITRPRILKRIYLLPGIYLMDCALSLGMIGNVRKNDR
jgi:GT2 family glycosyltransferase